MYIHIKYIYMYIYIYIYIHTRALQEEETLDGQGKPTFSNDSKSESCLHGSGCRAQGLGFFKCNTPFDFRGLGV